MSDERWKKDVGEGLGCLFVLLGLAAVIVAMRVTL